MRKFSLFLAVLCSSVLLAATPLNPQVKLINANTAQISWDSYGIYTSYRIVVSQEELTGNPEYWKGINYVRRDTFFVATGLMENHLYHVYLQGVAGYDIQEWVTTTFTPRDVNPCELTIETRCSFITWNGAGFYINEGSESKFFTHPDGMSGSSKTTYVSGGEPLRIVWHAESGMGFLMGEMSFTITDAIGNILVDVDKSAFNNLTDGQVLYEGTICIPACAATVSNLTALVNGTDFSVTWDASGADHFEVAVLRKSSPTEEEIEAAAEVTNQASYSFIGEQYAGYNVFVRAVCADGEKGLWHSVLVHGEMEYSQELVAAVAEPITLDYIHTGDLLEDGLIGTDGPEIHPLRVLSFDLEDSAELVINFMSDEITEMIVVVYQDTAAGQPWETIHGGPYLNTIELPKLKGKFYIILNTSGELGQYTLMIQAKKPLVPKVMPLGFLEQSDFTDAVAWTSPSYGCVFAKAYIVTPTDTTDVYMVYTSQDIISFGSNAIYLWIFKDEMVQDSIISGNGAGLGFDMQLDKGHTYYIVVAAVPQEGGKITDRYYLTMYPENGGHGAVTLTPKEITLNFKETTDFTDAPIWNAGGRDCYAKAYSITPANNTYVRIDFQSDDAVITGSGMMISPSIMAMVYENGMGMRDQRGSVMPSSYTYQVLYKDSTYYIVVATAPDYGGKATDTYTLSIVNMEDETPIVPIPIMPDVYIEGRTETIVPTLDEYAVAYEYRATKDQHMAFSIERLGEVKESMGFSSNELELKVYKDTIADAGDTYYLDRAEVYNYNYIQMQGSPEGTPYYFVVTSSIPEDYRIILRAEPDYDHLPIKGEIAVNAANRSVLSVKDGFTRYDMSCDPYWNGPFEAYQVPLEKDYLYMGLMHMISADGENIDNAFHGISSALFQPGAQQGSYEDNVAIADCMDASNDDLWTVLPIDLDSTVLDTIMYDAYFSSKFYEDSVIYEFSVEKIQTFTQLVEDAPLLRSNELPYAENGVFSDNKKVSHDNFLEFHNNPQTYIESEAGIYDALARVVRLAAGETLYMEFGGDEDAVIQVYDTLNNLLQTHDETSYNFPFESGRIENTESDSVDYIIVCSFNGVHIADKAWSLRMSTDHFYNLQVTPKADQESITLYESDDIAAAQAALGQLKLTAVDSIGTEMAIIENNPFVWVIDLTNNVATYEVNKQDLPMGYVFEYSVMFIEVDIERIPDLPTGFIDDIANDQLSVQKILRDNQVYIIRDGSVYNIMGQRVK